MQSYGQRMLTPSQNIESLKRHRFQNGSRAVIPYRQPQPRHQEPQEIIDVTPTTVVTSSSMGVVGRRLTGGAGDINPLAQNLAPSLASVLRPAGASRWMLPSVAAITPQYVEATLRGALAGNHVQAWELFDLMIDTDPEIAACCGEYVSGIICKRPVVKAYADEDEEPTPEAKNKQAVVSACLRNMRPDMANDENAFTGTLKDILFARFHGQSVLEVDWYNRQGTGLNVKQFNNIGNIIVPRSTFWVHPVCYAWDMNGRLGLRMALESQLKQAVQSNPRIANALLKNPSFDLVRSMVEPPAWNWINSQARPSYLMDFPENKFLIGMDKFKAGTIMGSGSCLRTLAWWWIASMFCGDWLLNFAQLFGIPFRKVTVTPSTSEQKKAELRQMLESMGSSGYVMLDTGNQLEFERAASAAGDSPQAFLFHFANEMKRKVILRQTMTGGSSSGSVGIGKGFGETEAEGPKDQCLQAGAMFAESVINLQLVPYILNVNFGDGGDMEAPTVTLVDEETGNYQDAQRDAILAKLINIPAPHLHQKYGIPEASPDDPIAGVDEGVLPPTPGGGFGGGEGGYSDEDEDDNDNGTEDQTPATAARRAVRGLRALKAARAARLDTTEKPGAKNVDAVNKALRDTAAPLVQRMAAIDKIQDVTVKKAALTKLLADLPKISAALKLDPQLAEATAIATRTPLNK